MLRSGAAVTKNSKTEIVGALYTRMLQFNENPTPFEYRMICKRLVEKHPTLQDLSDSGYVSCYNTLLVVV